MKKISSIILPEKGARLAKHILPSSVLTNQARIPLEEEQDPEKSIKSSESQLSASPIKLPDENMFASQKRLLHIGTMFQNNFTWR